jgi:hypothetical protein
MGCLRTSAWAEARSCAVSKRRLVITAVPAGSSQSEVARTYGVSQSPIGRRPNCGLLTHAKWMGSRRLHSDAEQSDVCLELTAHVIGGPRPP